VEVDEGLVEPRLGEDDIYIIIDFFSN